jgi:twinkle protein
MNQQSKFLYHSPCENCGSRDNCGVYDDGHTYCFGCTEYKTANGDLPKKEKIISNMIEGIYEAIPSRKLDSDTCQKFNYQTGNYQGKPVHIANFYDKDYNRVAQKLRFQDKSFIWLGDPEKITLFGQQIWRDGGKTIVITEGEIDCLSVSKVQNNRYPVVSVPSGATSAKKYIKKELEWLSKFESIILMFDNDEAGTKATIECANILPVRKVKIAKLPAKDPNELLQKNKSNVLYDSIWEAKAYTPQGIVEGNQTKDLLLKDDYVETCDLPVPEPAHNKVSSPCLIPPSFLFNPFH